MIQSNGNFYLIMSKVTMKHLSSLECSQGNLHKKLGASFGAKTCSHKNMQHLYLLIRHQIGMSCPSGSTCMKLHAYMNKEMYQSGKTKALMECMHAITLYLVMKISTI